MRSVNIFRQSTHEKLPIRIEFWESDKLVRIDYLAVIDKRIADSITEFIINSK